MKKKRHSPEQIVWMLERGEQMIKDPKTVDVVVGELGISRNSLVPPTVRNGDCI